MFTRAAGAGAGFWPGKLWEAIEFSAIVGVLSLLNSLDLVSLEESSYDLRIFYLRRWNEDMGVAHSSSLTLIGGEDKGKGS